MLTSLCNVNGGLFTLSRTQLVTVVFLTINATFCSQKCFYLNILDGTACVSSSAGACAESIWIKRNTN